MKACRFAILIASLIILPAVSSSQGQQKDKIEFSFFSTQNMQAEYSSKFGDVVYTSNLKLNGPDIGLYLDYKRRLYDNLFVKAGLGYMDFMVNKIENKMNDFGPPIYISNGRPINYQSYVALLYFTTKYHYHNLLFHFGVEKQFKLLPKLYLFSGVNYFHAYRISQKYFIPKDDIYYRTGNKGNFGDFFHFDLGVSKKFEKLTLSSGVVLPIYKSWNRDIEFREDPRQQESNWFDGIGISIGISYP